MELTCQLFRAVSHPPRLHILRGLAVLGEQNVTQLVDATQRPQFEVSANLRVLATSGLVWRRRSGSFIHYRLAERPSRPVTRTVLDALTVIYAAVRPDDPRAVIQSSLDDDPQRSDTALTAWFGAFTHPRRLQIIRFLHTRETADVPLLVRTLSMSHSACWRHVTRLADCGVVRIHNEDGVPTVKAARCSDPIRQRILLGVIETLNPRE